MNRRRLLQALAAGASLSAAGCLGSSDDGTNPRSTTTRTSTTGGTTTTTDGRRVAIERVKTYDYAIRLNDLGGSPAGSIPTVAELNERERTVVETAIEGTYSTDELPDWLVEFASGTSYVEREGTYYRLDASLPTYTITASETSESEVDGDIASYDEYEAAVTHDGVVMSGLLRMAMESGGTKLPSVWPKLREFLSTYDAVRYRGDVVAVSMSEDDPGAPYTVTAEQATPADVADGPVWNASDADADLREVVRAAGRESGVYSLADPPSGLFEKLDAHEYVHLDGTFYTTYVEGRGALPVSLSASVPDATLGADDDARLRLAVRNESHGEIEVNSGAPVPFGLLDFHPEGGDEHYVLWSDAYEESDYVQTDGHDVKMVADIGLVTTVAAGETTGRTFEIEQSDLPTGRYVIESSVGVSVGEEGGTLPFRVVFSVS
ncbi:hypothetical protein [Halomicrococcus gelatinilyticus]|uniref:hypothetical protein n=1 Tax=Halomicrococcus gelatinilyticus TaxID=1702103 RepID=UPI002E125905